MSKLNAVSGQTTPVIRGVMVDVVELQTDEKVVEKKGLETKRPVQASLWRGPAGGG